MVANLSLPSAAITKSPSPEPSDPWTRRWAASGDQTAQHEPAARARAEVLLGFAEDHGELVRMLFGRGSEGASVGADALDHMVARIEADLARNRPAGADLLHPAVTAQALVGMWARIVTWWAESPGRAPREAVLQTMIDLQLSGVR